MSATTPHRPLRRWPNLPALLLALGLSTLAGFILKDFAVTGGVYDMLSPDDPVARQFNEIARTTPELEQLIVVCEPGPGLTNTSLDELTAHALVKAHTSSLVQPSRSSVYAFALMVDPTDWRETAPIIHDFQGLLAEVDGECGLTGTPAILFEAQTRFNTDLRQALLIAIILVTLLFARVYRIGWLALLMLLPVFAGIAWGLAAYVLVRGAATLLAATVPTLLIGIGIDHCIHLIQSTRFHLQHTGLDRQQAILRAWWQLLRPITVATLTTASAFLALTTAELRGLADLGWAGAFVTIGVYLSCLLLVPVLLSICPQRWLAGRSTLQSGLGWLAIAIKNHKQRILLLTAALLIGGVVLSAQLEFLDDNRKLQSQTMHSMYLQQRIADEHELSASPILLQFDSPLDAIELQAEVDRPEGISALIAVTDVPGLLQVHTMKNPFAADGYQHSTTSLAHWIDELGLGSYRFSGAPALNVRIDEIVKDDVTRVPLVAVAAVLLVLVIGTRSAVRPILVLLPLLLALLSLGGLMALLNVPLSLVTVAALPLIVGIGVDGGVHILAAWRRHNAHIEHVFADTGIAILVTILTSTLAFIAFVFADSPAMVQFGAQVSTAMLGVAFGTLMVLPLLLRCRIDRDA